MDDRHARHRRADADRRRRPVDGFRTSSSRRFVRLVDDAVAALPKRLLALLDSIAIVVEDVPPAPSPSDQAAVVTDLADHLGLTDDDLDELGWD
jgi:predicted Zn-dependent protease with MMP-like domain